MHKYHAQKTYSNGIKFDSKAEARRYEELRILVKAGIIKDLELQPIFVLQPSFRRNGKLYREIKYKADFGYTEGDRYIVEDVKGVETPAFKLKKKLFLAKHESFVFRTCKNGRTVDE